MHFTLFHGNSSLLVVLLTLKVQLLILVHFLSNSANISSQSFSCSFSVSAKRMVLVNRPWSVNWVKNTVIVRKGIFQPISKKGHVPTSERADEWYGEGNGGRGGGGIVALVMYSHEFWV